MKQKGFDYLKKITAVDYNDRIEVLYFLYDTSSTRSETVKVVLDPGDLAVPSIVSLYKAADWYERELAEMFGVKILGRRTRRLLLEKWNGADAPLRKSFVWGSDYRKSGDN